jgi:hypothetical protein
LRSENEARFLAVKRLHRLGLALDQRLFGPLHAVRHDEAAIDLRERHLPEKGKKVGSHAELHLLGVRRTADGGGENARLAQIVLGRVPERLFLFDDLAISEPPSEVEIPFLGHILGQREFRLLRGLAEALTADAGSALPNFPSPRR